MSGEDFVIKPCPFCGGEARLEAYRNQRTQEWFIVVKCMTCRASGGTASEYKEDVLDDNYSWATEACDRAIRRWNTRVKEKTNE